MAGLRPVGEMPPPGDSSDSCDPIRPRTDVIVERRGGVVASGERALTGLVMALALFGVGAMEGMRAGVHVCA